MIGKSLRGLVDKMAPSIRKGFFQSIVDLRQEIKVTELLVNVRAGRVDKVLEALMLDPSNMDPLARSIKAAFEAAGIHTTKQMPKMPRPDGALVIARWQSSNPRSVEVAQQQVGDLISELMEDQRTGIRQLIVESIAAGRPPKRIAEDLAGRVSAGGRRTGGIIGLRSDQMKAVSRMRDELTGQINVGAYLSRKARDRRFDAMVKKAASEGRELTEEEIYRLTSRYADKLLMVRAEAVARTESHNAVMTAQSEAMRQQIDSGKVDARFVTKVWTATKDPKTRDSHMELDSKEIPWSEPFISPKTGAAMMHPGDRSMGAQGSDVINCRCHMYLRVDRLAALREKERG